jgi:diguanylate cyclase (GGDEF)-like protein
MLKSLIIAIVVPACLFALAIFAVPMAAALPQEYSGIRHVAPYVLLGIAMILSLGFNQTRLFFMLLLGTLFLALLLGDAQQLPLIREYSANDMVQPMGIIYPLALIAFLFMQERGLFTYAGLIRLAVVVFMPVAVLMWTHPGVSAEMQWLGSRFLPPWLDAHTSLSDAVVLLHLVAMLAVLMRMVLRPGIAAAGFLTLVAGNGLALHVYPSTVAIQLVVSAAALSILFALVRNNFHLAYRDELTGLPTRRSLRDQLLKLGRSYSIAMVDVDHFKRFNDRYGHDVGDQVLKMVAGFLARAGGGCKAYRYGGEEFTLVFSGKQTADAIPHLEALRGAIADARFVVRSKPRPKRKANSKTKARRNASASAGRKQVGIRVSIGVADNHAAGSPEQVVKAADKALYRAKKKGRNRVAT